MPLEPSADADDPELVKALRGRADAPGHFLTRFVFVRALGFIYAIAFLILHHQGLPLIGSHGLLPAARVLESRHAYGSFWQAPTLFWFGASDAALRGFADAGLALSLLVVGGASNALLMAALWALYLSFVHVGQIFYGYGWETLLLEAGFLAIFVCPLTHVLPRADRSPMPRVQVILLRWLLFRVMFGAGLIKLRGDACWRDLTCLVYHYETQPVPHVLSWLLYQMPRWFHVAGAAFNHFVELVVPFFLFVPRLCNAAALLVIAFQGMLILSGNLSFLNWLTIAVALGCFDDAALRKVLPRRVARRFDRARDAAQPGRARTWTAYGLSVVVGLLSVSPVLNMLSPRQRMNTSFEPLHLVNSYGAFGSIGRERHEVIIEGTRDDPRSPDARWIEYQFKCKPGDVRRVPCWITPYHYRLDWQMWFAAFTEHAREPWFVHLVYELLQNDPGVLSLMADNPFPGRPPRFIRAERYRYRFTRFGEPGWWSRERAGAYLPPVSLDNPSLLEFLGQSGLLRAKDVKFDE
jgi:hypothetical protein